MNATLTCFATLRRDSEKVRSAKASGRLKTTSVMQTLSGLSGRLSHGKSDFTLPPAGSSEGRGGLILPSV